MFVLTAHDTSEDFDDEPASLLELAEWLAAREAGAAPYDLDPHESVGFRLTDGDRMLVEVAWGSADALAPGCHHAAERLRRAEPALLRSNYLGPSVYLWFVPNDDAVLCGLTLDRAPDDVFPFTPAPMPNDAERIRVLYQWMASEVQSWLPRGMSVDRENLIANLEASALVASKVAGGTTAPPTLASHPGAARPETPGTLRLRLLETSAHRIELVRALRALTDEAYEPAKAWAKALQAGETIEVTPSSSQRRQRFAADAAALGFEVS